MGDGRILTEHLRWAMGLLADRDRAHKAVSPVPQDIASGSKGVSDCIINPTPRRFLSIRPANDAFRSNTNSYERTLFLVILRPAAGESDLRQNIGSS